MINVSNACKIALHKNSKVIVKGNIDLSDGTHMELSGNDFMANTVGFSQASSTTSSFDIGAAVIEKVSFTLNNYDGKFDTFDFTDSAITIWVGVLLENGTMEWIKKGVFTIEQPDAYGSTISLSAYDNLTKFEKPYSDVTTAYPARLQVIVSDICLHCGVPIGFSQFDNYNFSIPERPDDSAISCLDMISYVAQISGHFATCDADGRLKLKWYNMSILDSAYLNGGVFDTAKPYASGDSANGGNFIDYSSGDDFDGGNFADEYVNLQSFTGFSVCTDDVVITGIKVLVTDDEEKTYLYGTDDYTLTISDNPLIDNSNANVLANYLGQRIVGMRFRPFSLQAQSDPTIEAGDCCYITDRKENIYISVITSLNYKIGSYESISCNAETPARNKATHYSKLSKTAIELRKNQKEELSNYDKQVQDMNKLAMNAMGFYQTVEKDETDGSQIVYMHDKPTIANSKIVYKETIDGFFLSQDGGKTYVYGRDSSGNVIVNVLSAIGIICDWIKGGTLTLGGDNNKDGSCTVYDANGSVVARLDKNGLVTNSAHITGGIINISTDDEKFSSITLRFNDFYLNLSPSGMSVAVKETGLMCKYGYDGIFFASDNYHSTTRFKFGNTEIDRSGIEVGNYVLLKAAVSEILGWRFSQTSFGNVSDTYSFSNVGCWIKNNLNVGNGNVIIKPYGSQAIFINSGDIFGTSTDVTVNKVFAKSLSVSGTKSRISKTQNYSKRLLYCYEMPKPYFGDTGEAVLDENGLCYIFMDDIFLETISTDCKYQVFLQKYGKGDLWVNERTPTHFIIKGTPNLSFAWEIKARQLGFETERLEAFTEPEQTEAINYETEAQNYVQDYYKEILNYEESN